MPQSNMFMYFYQILCPFFSSAHEIFGSSLNSQSQAGGLQHGAVHSLREHVHGDAALGTHKIK